MAVDYSVSHLLIQHSCKLFSGRSRLNYNNATEENDGTSGTSFGFGHPGWPNV
jgi:hypothetical protein